MIVRRERPADEARVDALHRDAFGRAVEADLLGALRADAGWLPELSLVAEDDDGRVLGHVCCTRGTVDGRPAALGLGPIAVAPARQGEGVGSILVHAVVAAAEACGEGLVCLLGDPALYGRLGFRDAAELALLAPDPAWGRHFQARALAGHDPARHAGAFAYAAPFDDV